MKKWLFAILFLPMLSWGQYDFETYFLKIDAISLPEIPEVNMPSLNFQLKTNLSKTKITDFVKVTVQNYWVPVDMETALTTEEKSYAQPDLNYPKLKSKEFGFSLEVNGNNSRFGTQSNRVRNTVYREARPVFFCSPLGIYNGN